MDERMNAEMEKELLRNDEHVSHLREMAFSSEGLNAIPEMVAEIIENDRWMKRIIRDTGQPAEYTEGQFVNFVTDPPLKGLGLTLARLSQLVDSDPIVQDKVAKLAAGKKGKRPKKERDTDNRVINSSGRQSPVGNTRLAGLNRLRKDRPDLHRRVLDAELSVKQAKREAGWVKPTVEVRTDDMPSAARTLKRKLTDEQIAELKSLL